MNHYVCPYSLSSVIIAMGLRKNQAARAETSLRRAKASLIIINFN